MIAPSPRRCSRIGFNRNARIRSLTSQQPARTTTKTIATRNSL
jgi:ribosomal protein L37E